MRSLKVIIPAILIFILIVGGVYTIYQSQVGSLDNLTITTQPTPKNNFPQSTPSAKPQVNGATNITNTPATGPEDELEIKNIGISVSNVNPGQHIVSPFTIAGIANVTSQIVIIKIYDNTNSLLGQNKATACISLVGCNFQTSIAFQKPQTQTGYVQIYSPSTLNSDHLFEQTIPVSY